jgi:hypothetical protein
MFWGMAGAFALPCKGLIVFWWFKRNSQYKLKMFERNQAMLGSF